MKGTQKMEKTARVIDAVLKIIQILLIIGIAGLTVALILMHIPGSTVTAAIFPAFQDLDVELREGTLSYSGTTGVSAGILSVFVMPGVCWFALHVFRSILSPVRYGRPFEEGVSHKMLLLGWIVLIGGGISEVLSLAAEYLLFQSADLMSVFNRKVVKSVTFEPSFNFAFIVFGIAFLLLSFIFRYGENLQRESNETL